MTETTTAPATTPAPLPAVYSTGRLLCGLVVAFVILSALVTADGLFREFAYRTLLVQYGVIAIAGGFVCAVLYRAADGYWLVGAATATAFATATLMLAPPKMISLLWLPFVIAPIGLAFYSGMLLTNLEWVLTGGLLVPRTSAADHWVRLISAGVLAAWVTAGGIYFVGWTLSLPYIDALRNISVFEGILDI